MNTEVSSKSGVSPFYADIINWFQEQGKSYFQPLTAPGLTFLRDMTSDTFRIAEEDVWVISGTLDEHDAQNERLEYSSAEVGVVIRLVN